MIHDFPKSHPDRKKNFIRYTRILYEIRRDEGGTSHVLTILARELFEENFPLFNLEIFTITKELRKMTNHTIQCVNTCIHSTSGFSFPTANADESRMRLSGYCQKTLVTFASFSFVDWRPKTKKPKKKKAVPVYPSNRSHSCQSVVERTFLCQFSRSLFSNFYLQKFFNALFSSKHLVSRCAVRK